MLYATTRRFLEVFGLSRLDDLPTLRELEELAPSEEASASEEDAEPASDGDPGPEVAAPRPDAHEPPRAESPSELH